MTEEIIAARYTVRGASGNWRPYRDGRLGEAVRMSLSVSSVRKAIRQTKGTEAVITQATALIPLSFLLTCCHGKLEMMDSSLTQEVLATDDARIAAARNSDAAALEKIYADEFRLITHTGLV